MEEALRRFLCVRFFVFVAFGGEERKSRHEALSGEEVVPVGQGESGQNVLIGWSEIVVGDVDSVGADRGHRSVRRVTSMTGICCNHDV